MAKQKKMPLTDQELIAVIRQEKAGADYSGVNVLSNQREQADRFYAGDSVGVLQPTTGMSGIVNNVVRPVTTTLTTYLSKIFTSDKETVVFNYDNPELAPVAKQTMDLINHILWKENRGYDIINGAARDAALHKNTVVKITWDESPTVKFEEFEGMDEDAIDIVMVQLEEMGAEVHIDEKDEDEGSYTLRIEMPRNIPHIELLPPEEFLINEGATDINDKFGKTRYVAHRKRVHLGDLQILFPDVDVTTLSAGEGDTLGYDYETLNRHASDGTYNFINGAHSQGSMMEVELTESWVKADMYGDGKNVWVHAFSVGNTLLFKEEWQGAIPFASFTYFPIEHKFYGLSVYDVCKDYQLALTGVTRGEIDRINQQNTFRLIADPRFLNERVLQSNRPGLVPAKAGFDPRSVMQIPAPPGSPNTQQMINEIWSQVEREIGINVLTGAISSDVEKSGNDAAKTAMVIDNASAKVEEYSRRFAEGFLRDIIWVVYDLLIQHKDDQAVLALVEMITPGAPFLAGEQPLTKSMLCAKVGLGHLTDQQKVSALQQFELSQQQMEAANPGSIPIEKKLNVAYEKAKAMGFDNYLDFFPSAQEAQAAQQAAAQAAQQQQPDPLMELQAAKIQADTQLVQAKVADIQVDNEISARKQALEEQKAAAEIAIEVEQERPAHI